MNNSIQIGKRISGRCSHCNQVTESIGKPREIACKWGRCNGVVNAN